MSPEREPGRPQVTATAITRSYAVPFIQVWDAGLAVVGGLRGWRILASDPHEGTIRLLSVSPVQRRPLEGGIRMWLDELGQTKLEVRFEEPRHRLLPAAAPSRAERFLGRLERLLAVRRRG